jgi:sugar phosphate isomerase/epimerase
VKLGGPVFAKWSTPDEWAQAHIRAGFAAAYCPVDETADARTVQAFADAAVRAGIVMAEVGAWSNPISRDADEARKAVALCQARLDLAERIGARCCVNIAGSRHPAKWDGPHPDNYAPATFDMIVGTVRRIIDAVKPKRTFYTLECMYWIAPDSAESQERLVRSIDRKAFAVHFDPVNMINSAERYAASGAFIRDFVRRLGPLIRSCHAKDVAMGDEPIVHLTEVAPGQGGLDFRAYLDALGTLDPDTPLMLEHLRTETEYAAAAEHIRGMM